MRSACDRFLDSHQVPLLTENVSGHERMSYHGTHYQQVPIKEGTGIGPDVCQLCGFDRAQGEHGIFEFRPGPSMSVIICKPIVVTMNPRRLGVITNIE